jgi:L-lactate dehydrogenase complex protein LldG
VGIDLPGLLLRVRAGKVEAGSQPALMQKEGPARQADKPNTPSGLAFGLNLFTWAAVSPRRFTMAQSLASVFGRIGSRVIPTPENTQGDWLRLPPFTGWGLGKDFPAPAAQTFHQRWEKLKAQPVAVKPDSHKTSSIQVSENVPEIPALDLIETFARELTALGAHLTTCQETEAAEIVLRLLEERATNSLLAWEPEGLPEGLLEELESAGVRVMHPTTETTEASSQVRVGLTGATAAVADTGTLFLTGGPGQALSASLLPEVHIAILREADLYPHLPEVLARRELRQASAAVLISGPSRTADIEMTLTIGVHGPGELHVICIREKVSPTG